jgi:4-amino-4-deoxy-L-arabinose transferase-like glycosyltransferase
MDLGSLYWWVSSAGPQRAVPWLIAALLALLAGVYFWGLGETGLLGPDEPRYASIGRAMQRSGDWVTPRLWGEPWFEKPALLYWMIGAGHAAGLPDEKAARWPVAALSLAFLAFYGFAITRLAGERVAWTAVLFLGLSAGWLAFSQVGVTDLPLAAAVNIALFAALLWLERGWSAGPWVAGLGLGVALLAKGLVGPVLLLPLLWWLRGRWRAVGSAGLLSAGLAALWYAPMLLRHGRAFVDEFFLRHHFGRFTTGELQHVQPMWFYVPVLLGWLYPWVPFFLASLWPPPASWSKWRQALAATVLFGFFFFSLSSNKLPGYVVPLLPALCAWMAASLEERGSTPRLFFWTGFSLFLIPVAASVLPEALLHGLRRAPWQGIPWEYFAFSIVAGLAALALERWNRRGMALGVLAACAAGGVVYIKMSAFPVLDRVVSARGLAQRVEAQTEPVCVYRLHRSLRYGLNYYVPDILPSCEEAPQPIEIDQAPGGLPVLRRATPRDD